MSVYVYESHLGGLYTSDDYISYDELYCEQCGDSDYEIGSFDTFEEFLRCYADNHSFILHFFLCHSDNIYSFFFC